MKVKTSEASGRVLDYLAAVAEGRALRKPVRGTNAEAAHKQVPFTMFEVVETHHPDGKVSHRVEEITVTRFGILPGCSNPTISFTQGRRRASGTVSLFYFDRAEADLECYGNTHGWLDGFSPSTNRDQGYEIVDRKKININYCRDLRDKNGLYIHAEMNTHIYHGYWRGDHEKPLIAAMRCYVASELGEEVDVPDELTELGETK
jgi:hypothetical protein